MNDRTVVMAGLVPSKVLARSESAARARPAPSLIRPAAGMMGGGVIDLAAIRRMVEEAGYVGHCEVEIFSAQSWWKRDPAEVLQVCIQRHQSVV